MRSPRALVLAVGVGVVSVALAAQVPAPSPGTTPVQTPTFRGGVEIVTVDVTVLDSARRPVRGLTSADFTLLENGQPQPIVAFAPVDVPDVVTEGAAWTREVAPDVASNALDARRLIVIMMDDGDSRFDPGVAKFAKTIANRVIDGLGPADLAAVAFTFQGRAQTFTRDREQLRAAVNSFTPRRSTAGGPAMSNAAINPAMSGTRAAGGPLIACQNKVLDGGCSVDAIRHASDALKAAPPGRKLLVYISSGGVPQISVDNPDVLDQIGPVAEMLRSLQQSNIAVYAFGAEGLTVGRNPAEDGMRMLAENTGGRAAVATNEPWKYVPDVFRENSSYYLLGFRSTAGPRDVRYRRLAVRVNRPGLDVRTREGYFPPKREKEAKSSSGPPSALDAAITKAMPTGALPLSVTTAVFVVPGRKTAELAVIAGVRDAIEPGAAPTSRAETRTVNVIATAYDSVWKNKGALTQAIQLTLTPDAHGELDYDVVSRLPLAPGRYEIRFAADAAGRAGSVFVDLDVPDFVKAPLSLSGAVLQLTPAGPVAPSNPLAGVIPVVPTARRSFGRDAKISAFVRVYQGASTVLGPVTMTARVVDDQDKPVFDQTMPMEAARFSGSRAADFQVDLPIARWAAGEYLLTLEAARGQATARRAIRLTIR